MVTNTAIIMIMVGNFFYAYQCIFQTRSYIQKYGFGEGSAIMTRLVGTFAAGFGIILLIALLTTIKGGWLLFTYGFIQATIGAVVCYRTINTVNWYHSYWVIFISIFFSRNITVSIFNI